MRIRLPTLKRSLNISDVVKTKQQISDVIDLMVSDTMEHFSRFEGGWKLDLRHIQNDAINTILGVDIFDEINQAFINAGLIIEYEDGIAFLKTEEPYCPIFMNTRTGKLHVVEDSDDKSYIFKFRESNGYVEIGRL
jgi:hypothetical protein